MSDIKVIEGLEPLDVLNRAVTGEKWATKHHGRWLETMPADRDTFGSICGYVSNGFEIAIIDTAAPSIDWDKFNWDFFYQYGGLPVVIDGMEYKIDSPTADSLRESPFYYWPGGEQPLPDNVEVETIWRDGAIEMSVARDFEWSHFRAERGMGDVIAFRLTGKVIAL